MGRTDTPDYKGYLGPPCWGGWAWGYDPPLRKKSMSRNLKRGGHVLPRDAEPREEEKEDPIRVV